MGKVLAYTRTSTDKQDLNNQKLEILEFARKRDLKVDDFLEISISSRKTTKQRRIDELMETLKSSDILIVSELSRLGRSMVEVVSMVNEMTKRSIRLIAIKENLDLSRSDIASKMAVAMFSLFAEVERDLISARTKEALAGKKRQGVILGKPKGTIQKSIYDKDLDKITALLKVGLSVRKIAKVLGYKTHITLNGYINKRKIKESLSVGVN